MSMPDVRMLWLVDMDALPWQNNVLDIAGGIVAFVKRVEKLANIQVRLLMRMEDFLQRLADGGAQSSEAANFFDELPPSITHYNVSVDSNNALNRSYQHLAEHGTFWPARSPKIIKALVVMSNGLVDDRVHALKETAGLRPGFEDFIKKTKRKAGFHLFGFLDLRLDMVEQSVWNKRTPTVADRHVPVPYQYYVDQFSGKLFFVVERAGQNQYQIPTPARLEWSAAFDALFNSTHVEIKKLAPNVFQTQCVITKVRSVSINDKRLARKKFTTEPDERLLKIRKSLKQGDSIVIHYETTVEE